MKHLLIVLLAVGALQARAEGESTISTSAQGVNDYSGTPAVHITPSASFTEVGLKGDTLPWKADRGVSIGAYAEVGSGTVTLQTGLFYNDFNTKAVNSEVVANLHLSYFSVPVLAKYNIMGNLERTLYVKAGVQPSFLAAKSVTIAGVTEVTASSIQIADFDLPAVVSVGGSYPVGPNRILSAEASYMRGLTNVNNNPENNSKVRTEGLLITAGISVGI